MAVNTKYYREEIVNGWRWRIEIIPASTHIPSEYDWDIQAIADFGIDKIGELAAKFDKLPIGAAVAESLKISFNLFYCQDELAACLTQPVKQYPAGGLIQYNWYYGGHEAFYLKWFDLSTIIIIKTNFDTDPEADIETLFIGVQKLTLPEKNKITADWIFLECEFINIGKWALENITAADILNRFCKAISEESTENHIDPACFDIICKYCHNDEIKTLGILDGLINIPSGTHYENGVWVKFIDFDDIVMKIANDMILRLMRLEAGEIDNVYMEGAPFDAFEFYKRNYDVDYENNQPVNGSQSLLKRGAALAYSDLYFLGMIYLEPMPDFWFYENAFCGGFLVKEKDIKSLHSWPSIWDYYKELTEANYIKMTIKAHKNGFKIIFNKIFDGEPVILSISESYNKEPEINTHSGLISGANGTIDGLSDKDTSKFSSATIGSMADQSFDFPAVFHNLPTMQGAMDYLDKIFRGFLSCYSNGRPFANDKIYYREEVSSGQFAMVKIHEHCKIDNGINTKQYYEIPEDFDGIIDNLYESYGGEFSDWLNFIIIALQQASNNVYAVAKEIFTQFSKFSQSDWEGNFRLRADMPPNSIGSVFNLPNTTRFAGHRNDAKLQLLYSFIPETALMLECTWDRDADNIKAKFIFLESS